MAKAQGKVKMQWSPEFAYAIGLLVTDGNLSSDGRHMSLSSKDEELLISFRSCLGITNKIGRKARGGEIEKKYCVIQFGDVLFYNFCLSIGLHPNKSKTLTEIKIPRKYFFDFLRGHFDGDGTFHSYWDKRWKSSFMFYTTFLSASRAHIDWLRQTITDELGVIGHITKPRTDSTYQLRYAKKESLMVLRAIYRNKKLPFLARKKLKIKAVLGIVGESL